MTPIPAPPNRRFQPGQTYLSSAGRVVRWPSVKTLRGLRSWLQKEVQAEIASVPALSHLETWFTGEPRKWPDATAEDALDVLFYRGGLE